MRNLLFCLFLNHVLHFPDHCFTLRLQLVQLSSFLSTRATTLGRSMQAGVSSVLYEITSILFLLLEISICFLSQIILVCHSHLVSSHYSLHWQSLHFHKCLWDLPDYDVLFKMPANSKHCKLDFWRCKHQIKTTVCN